MSAYVLLKWFHVLMAITAVGANVTYGVWLVRAAREPQHLRFALQGVKFLDDRIANPAYGLLLLSGMAMAGLGKISLATPWLLTGLILFVVLVVIAAAGYTPALRRQIEALDAGGPDSPAYQRFAARARGLGILLGVIAVVIVFMMVAKPALWG